MGRRRLPPRRTEGGREKILDEAERCRGMSATERLELMQSLRAYAIELACAGCRARHPGWTEEEVYREVLGAGRKLHRRG